eukprot:COSAG04_NODE_15887_length_517_cov_0.811005_1_plen_81_part_10
MATMNPGLEFVVAAELAAKLGHDAVLRSATGSSGKVFFEAAGLGEQLQSPENIFAVVATESALPLERPGLAALHRLATTAP